MTHLPQSVMAGLKRWRLIDAARLFLSGHRPLAFVVGQGLHMFAPIAEIAGLEQIDELANLLSEGEGLQLLERQFGEE